MLEVSEVGNKVGKAEFQEALPDLRVGLINAQYERFGRVQTLKAINKGLARTLRDAPK